MKPLLTIGALDHISYFLVSKVSSQERTNLALPFFVQLTKREQQALRTPSKYFRGGPNILKCLERLYISGVQIFRDRPQILLRKEGRGFLAVRNFDFFAGDSCRQRLVLLSLGSADQRRQLLESKVVTMSSESEGDEPGSIDNTVLYYLCWLKRREWQPF